MQARLRRPNDATGCVRQRGHPGRRVCTALFDQVLGVLPHSTALLALTHGMNPHDVLDLPAWQAGSVVIMSIGCVGCVDIFTGAGTAVNKVFRHGMSSFFHRCLLTFGPSRCVYFDVDKSCVVRVTASVDAPNFVHILGCKYDTAGCYTSYATDRAYVYSACLLAFIVDSGFNLNNCFHSAVGLACAVGDFTNQCPIDQCLLDSCNQHMQCHRAPHHHK